MIDFPENYFEEEVRCNFKVSHMMKCAWAAQLEVLQAIEKICKRHNLQYYAIYGTLLGAVRHKGFIPWDDDMDIAMKREDYIRFFLYAKEELPPEFCIRNPYSEAEWTESFSRVMNSNKIDVSKDRLHKFHGCPFVVGIDIFPLDYLSKNPQVYSVQSKMIEMAQNSYLVMTYLRENGEQGIGEDTSYKEALAQNIQLLSNFTGIKRQPKVTLNTWLLQMFDAVCMMGNNEKTDTMGAFQIDNGLSLIEKIKTESLEKTVKMSFETISIDVPIGFDEALKNVYGRYRKLQFSPSHDYPFYKKQVPLMQGKNMWDEEELNEVMNQKFDDYQLDNYGTVDKEPPEEWKQKLEQARTDGKKIVLFGTSLVDFMMQEEKYIDRLMHSLKELVRNKNDVFVWWRPDKVEGYIYFYTHPEMENKYKECIKFFEDHDLGILDETEELVRALNRTDIYWGDETIAYDRYRQSGKPCWLQQEKDFNFVLDYLKKGEL